MTIEQAIETLWAEYQTALQEKGKHDPVAVALYRTYRKADPDHFYHPTKAQAQEKKMAIMQILKDEGRSMSVGEIVAWLSEEYGIKSCGGSIRSYMTTLSMTQPITETRFGREIRFSIER